MAWGNREPEEFINEKFRCLKIVWAELRYKVKREEDESKTVSRLYVTLNFVPIKKNHLGY